MLILGLWGMSFHAVVVFSLGKDLLFKSVLGHCDKITTNLIFGFLLSLPFVEKMFELHDGSQRCPLKCFGYFHRLQRLQDSNNHIFCKKKKESKINIWGVLRVYLGYRISTHVHSISYIFTLYV